MFVVLIRFQYVTNHRGNVPWMVLYKVFVSMFKMATISGKDTGLSGGKCLIKFFWETTDMIEG